MKMIYNDNDLLMMKYCYGSAIAYDDSPIIAQFLCCVYYILSFTLFFFYKYCFGYYTSKC